MALVVVTGQRNYFRFHKKCSRLRACGLQLGGYGFASCGEDRAQHTFDTCHKNIIGPEGEHDAFSSRAPLVQRRMMKVTSLVAQLLGDSAGAGCVTRV